MTWVSRVAPGWSGTAPAANSLFSVWFKGVEQVPVSATARGHAPVGSITARAATAHGTKVVIWSAAVSSMGHCTSTTAGWVCTNTGSPGKNCRMQSGVPHRSIGGPTMVPRPHICAGHNPRRHPGLREQAGMIA
jgi:hypothetical protein